MQHRYAPPPPSSHRRPQAPGGHLWLARRSGALLSAAVALTVLAVAALVLPPAGTSLPSLQAVDAAAVRTLASEGGSGADCTLVVPANPLSAEGLATPYRLQSSTWSAGDCHETDPGQAAFVEAAIYDPAQHSLAIYRPLVVDKGSTPATPPVPVALPANAVV